MVKAGGNLETVNVEIDITKGKFHQTFYDEKRKKIELAIKNKFTQEVYKTGFWESEPLSFKNFTSFSKLKFIQNIKGGSSVKIFTATSQDGRKWNEWLEIDYSTNKLNSPEEKFLMIRVEIIAGEQQTTKLLRHSYFEPNNFIKHGENDEIKELVPYISSNPNSKGLAFSSHAENGSLDVFNGFTPNTKYYRSKEKKHDEIEYFGFVFDIAQTILSYELTPSSSHVSTMPKIWEIQVSLDTKNGLDGDWTTVDKRQVTWTNKAVSFSLDEEVVVKGIRMAIEYTTSRSRIARLQFYTPSIPYFELKQDYLLDLKDERFSFNLSEFEKVDLFSELYTEKIIDSDVDTDGESEEATSKPEKSIPEYENLQYLLRNKGRILTLKNSIGDKENNFIEAIDTKGFTLEQLRRKKTSSLKNLVKKDFYQSTKINLKDYKKIINLFVKKE